MNRKLSLLLLGAVALLPLSGCVSAWKYDKMKALEQSLQKEVNADEVKIEELENGVRVRMSSALLYSEGSVELTQKGRQALDKVAPELSKSAAQSFQIDIVGNTDNVPIGPQLAGMYPTNWELAGARAAIVVRYLQQKGVDPSKLEAISNGMYHPVASNDSPGGRAQNRRTDLLMRPTD